MIFIFVEGEELPPTQYVRLAGPDELDTELGRDYVGTMLCLMYADGKTLDN